MTAWLLIRSLTRPIIITVLLPVGLWWLASALGLPDLFEAGLIHVVWVATGCVAIGLGLVGFWWSVLTFRADGQTLEPKDTPTRLVTRGLYRICSCPMFLSVIFVLLGEGFLIHWLVFVEAAVFTVIIRAWYLPKVEWPKLLKLFGGQWVAYTRSVWHGLLPMGLFFRRYRYPRRAETA